MELSERCTPLCSESFRRDARSFLEEVDSSLLISNLSISQHTPVFMMIPFEPFDCEFSQSTVQFPDRYDCCNFESFDCKAHCDFTLFRSFRFQKFKCYTQRIHHSHTIIHSPLLCLMLCLEVKLVCEHLPFKNTSSSGAGWRQFCELHTHVMRELGCFFSPLCELHNQV